jgi:hypothetical protein
VCICAYVRALTALQTHWSFSLGTLPLLSWSCCLIFRPYNKKNSVHTQWHAYSKAHTCLRSIMPVASLGHVQTACTERALGLVVEALAHVEVGRTEERMSAGCCCGCAAAVAVDTLCH